MHSTLRILFLWVTLAGILSGIISSYLALFLTFLAAHNPGFPWWLLIVFGMLPIVISTGVAIRRRSPVQQMSLVGAALGATLFGVGLFSAWLSLDEMQFVKGLSFENATEHSVVVYTARQGDELRRLRLLTPGQQYHNTDGLRSVGPWLRVVAYRASGPLLGEDYNSQFPLGLSSYDERGFASPKLFDRSYGWDTLEAMAWRVVIVDSGPSP